MASIYVMNSDECERCSVYASLKSSLEHLIWTVDKVADSEIINPCSREAFCVSDRINKRPDRCLLATRLLQGSTFLAHKSLFLNKFGLSGPSVICWLSLRATLWPKLAILNLFAADAALNLWRWVESTDFSGLIYEPRGFFLSAYWKEEQQSGWICRLWKAWSNLHPAIQLNLEKKFRHPRGLERKNGVGPVPNGIGATSSSPSYSSH